MNGRQGKSGLRELINIKLKHIKVFIVERKKLVMMKKTVLFLVFLLTSSIIIAQGYTVEFKVKGVKNSKGIISGAIYNKASDFPTKENAYKGKVVDAQKGYVKLRFEDVPSGEYALAVLHDENNNEDLDTNILGIPKEGYCFSNNAKAKFGPPSFDKAKFSVNEDKYLTVFIKY